MSVSLDATHFDRSLALANKHSALKPMLPGNENLVVAHGPGQDPTRPPCSTRQLAVRAPPAPPQSRMGSLKVGQSLTAHRPAPRDLEGPPTVAHELVQQQQKALLEEDKNERLADPAQSEPQHVRNSRQTSSLPHGDENTRPRTTHSSLAAGASDVSPTEPAVSTQQLFLKPAAMTRPSSAAACARSTRENPRARVYGPGRHDVGIVRPSAPRRPAPPAPPPHTCRIQRPSQRKLYGGEVRRTDTAAFAHLETAPQQGPRPRSSPSHRWPNLCVAESPLEDKRRQMHNDLVPKPELIERSPATRLVPRPEMIERSPLTEPPRAGAQLAQERPSMAATHPGSVPVPPLGHPSSAKTVRSSSHEPQLPTLPRPQQKPAAAASSTFRLRPIHGFGASLAPYTGAPPDASYLYRRERTLGRGAFGSVALVTSSVTNERAAMKTIDRAKLFTAALKKTVEQEVRILKKLHHDGIVKLFEVIETPRAIHMVMEYSPGGNMQQLVRALKRIGEERAQPLFFQMVEAVDYCHSQRVCHRDLKLENFVLDRTQQRVQLIDFGLSVIWRPEHPLFKSYGTPCYTAPEIMSGLSYQGPQVDVWSLGVALTTMLTGALPFQAGSAPELKRRVMAGKYLISDSISELGRELIRSMLALAPERRAELREIREGQWLSGVAAKLPPPLAVRHDDPAAGAPLDAATLRQLESLGMAAETVEASVRAESYNHEAACYGLLLSARRGGSRGAS